MRVVERTALKTANREYKLAARRAMRSEIVRGFIELVLNSDDSYQRLGATSGSIVIGVRKKRNRQGATIWVRDAAEGMDLERLKAAVGEYGKAASGIYEGRSVRGYFGHGLKDAILGLGAGRIVSFKDGTMVMATLSFDRKGEPVVTYYEPARATPKLRAAHGIEANGTLVTLEVEPGVSIPQCDTLRDQLSRHYMLRRVMSQPTRTATLVYTTVVSGTEEQPLAYLEPVVDAVLIDEDIPLSGGGAARLVVKRATVQLESPRGQPLADGGFLVGSRDRGL